MNKNPKRTAFSFSHYRQKSWTGGKLSYLKSDNKRKDSFEHFDMGKMDYGI